MLRPDYSNLYKFLVSTGLILIALAFAAPWIVGKLSDGLLITQDELADLAPAARELWDARRSMAERAAELWPWVSGGFAIAGFAATGFGLLKWGPQQLIADRLEKTRLDEAELKVAKMSDPEIDAEAEREAVDESLDSRIVDQGEGAPVPTRESVEAVKRTIAEIENRVFFLLQAALRHGHRGRTHLKVHASNRLMMLDALFEARDPAYVDVIVEVKYLRGGTRIPAHMIQLALHAQAYRATTGRAVDPLLVVVIAAPAREQDYETRKKDVLRRVALADATLGESVKVAIVLEDELDQLEPDTFFVKLPRGIGERQT